MYLIAAKRGGKCLSETYADRRTKLLWECEKGHRWEARPNDIKKGSWCRRCAGLEKGTIEEMHRVALERGGKCLSTIYVDNKTKLIWECAAGHRWEAMPHAIKKGQWCRRCSGSEKSTIEEMQQIAIERGGKCLSKHYAHAHSKLLWECAEGHQWEATPNRVKKGGWCPQCSSGLGERICREFFEQLFEQKFPKNRPKWLVNKNGNQMELDGCCESLKLAFEHQGMQHYSVGTLFIKTKDALKKRQEDDLIKRQLCTQRGIVLTEVPEIFTLLPIDNVKTLIKNECERCGILLPLNFDTTQVDLKKAYVTSGLKEALKELQAIAKKQGGRCLSKNYIHAHSKLLWECAQGHQWKATPNSIKNTSSWCPKCAGNLKRTLTEMQCIAAKRGGKCLSNIYVGNTKKLLWECSLGHHWKAVPKSIIKGIWCPICIGHVKGTIEDMHRIASERGGKCLSNTYIENKVKLLWECAQGHQWKATPNSIKKGSWCRICAGLEKGTIEKMQSIAKERGGKCLSGTYVNNRTKLLWECAIGHQWETSPISIKNGHWCPFCIGQVKGTIEEMYRIASERNGKCLSNTYVNTMTKLIWECDQGHQWKATPNGIKGGYWCPYCAGVAKKTIEEMQSIANERGGVCLSDTYIDNRTKLRWQCAQGHQWEAIPESINRGSWCPMCAGKARGTLTEMQHIAAERGGECLSPAYVNNNTKLLWKCAKGHQWEAIPYSIKRGHWCPKCRNQKNHIK